MFSTLYKVNASTGGLTLLHTFTGFNAVNPALSDGRAPYGGVILSSDGFLYGTTFQGGSDDNGVVFKQTP